MIEAATPGCSELALLCERGGKTAGLSFAGAVKFISCFMMILTTPAKDRPAVLPPTYIPEPALSAGCCRPGEQVPIINVVSRSCLAGLMRCTYCHVYKLCQRVSHWALHDGYHKPYSVPGFRS